MRRSFTYSALVLRVRNSGESNREAWFLTAEEGIIRATLFGGPKSRLRSHTSPFHRGKLWIYHDPVRDSRKVTDFDVQVWRPGIRELYERSAVASALAETILAAHGGGGSWSGALDLADRTLDALDRADEGTCTRILIHFLWHWADLLGLRPELNRCGVCACEGPADGIVWYSRREGALLCPSCAGKTGGFPYEDRFPGEADILPVDSGCRRWLTHTEALDPSLLDRYTLDVRATRNAKALVTALLTGVFGKRLATWDF